MTIPGSASPRSLASGYVCVDVQVSLVTGQAAQHALEWRLVAADAQSIAAFGEEGRA